MDDAILARAREFDAADPLAEFRERFMLPEGVIYLDGTWLGALPRATPARTELAVRREWGGGPIRCWNDPRWLGAGRSADQTGAGDACVCTGEARWVSDL